MITEIGITAGEIWHYLDEKSSVTLEELMKDTGKSRELLLMSMGWLAREGHIFVDSKDGKFKATLNVSNKSR